MRTQRQARALARSPPASRLALLAPHRNNPLFLADTAKTRMMNQRQRLAALQAAAASHAAAGSSSVHAGAGAALHMGGSSVAAAPAAVANHPSAGSTASRALHAAAASSQIALDAAAAVDSAAAAAHKPASTPAAAPPLLYKSTLDCLRRTWAAEGLRGLYAGFSQQWLRLGPHTVITFLAYEQLRSLAGVRPV